MLRTFLMALVLGAALLPAQDARELKELVELRNKLSEGKKEGALEAVIIPVKTLSGDSFNRLVKLLSVFQARYTSDDKLRTIVVYAPKDVVAQMRRVIEELDKPGSDAAIGRNIELTLTFLRCSAKPSADAKPLSAEMEAVAKQIRAATQYKDVQLWDALPLHLQEGKEANHSMRMPMSIFGPQVASSNGVAMTQIRLYPESVVRKDTGRYVRFDRINIGFKIPYATTVFKGNEGSGLGTQFQYVDVGINTAGEFKEGQKTVLGKVSGVDDESAIFVVLAPKILD